MYFDLTTVYGLWLREGGINRLRYSEIVCDRVVRGNDDEIKLAPREYWMSLPAGNGLVSCVLPQNACSLYLITRIIKYDAGITTTFV